MIRNFKTLGLAVVAMLAMSAFIAAGAQASGGGTATVAGGGTVAYTATQTGGGHTFTLPGNRKMSCSSATFAGAITNNATKIQATPSYTGCTIELGVGGEKLPVTTDVSSCKYDFTLTGPSGAEWVADTTIVCEAGDDIKTNVYANAAEHTKGVTLCEYTIAANQELTGVTFRNPTATTVGIKTTSASMAYTKVKGPIGTCGGKGGTAVYQGDTLATGAGELPIQIH